MSRLVAIAGSILAVYDFLFRRHASLLFLVTFLINILATLPYEQKHIQFKGSEKVKFTLYFNTLKYLKLTQVIWRLIYRLRVIPLARKPEHSDCSISEWNRTWCAPKWDRATWDGESCFTFLSESHFINTSSDWNSSSRAALWNYNLHYLDCLNNQQELCSARGSALILDWISKNEDLNGVGWDPYCISLRIINIIKWMSREKCNEQKIVESLEYQALCLLRKIEYHVQANHLFTNAKALTFYGCFFQGKTAEKCLAYGVKLLSKELDEQFNNDGGHYEQSPMYHQILMWDLLDLLLLSECSRKAELTYLRDKLSLLVQKADEWRLAMLHPDGEIAFFNDAAFGIAPPTKVVEDYLSQLGFKLQESKSEYVSLEDSGYRIFTFEPSGKLIFDCSDISPAYQPGHAHADSLSIELSLFNKRWFVNSGTSVYGTSKLREFQRSTMAHNTVSINRFNSSEVWGGFRVAKRARCKIGELIKTKDSIELTASHDGYKSQALGNEHVRSLRVEDSQITISDTLNSTSGDYSMARYYLHPDVEVRKLNSNSVILEREGEAIIVECSNQIEVEESHWYPKFGQSLSNYCIMAKLKDGQLITRIKWNI